MLDGETRATIVYQRDAQAETEQAWQDLASYLQQATGKGFVAVSEDRYQSVEGARPIFVGRVEALEKEDAREVRRMDRDAFLVRVTADRGSRRPHPGPPTGRCAVPGDYVGVRWLIPGPAMTSQSERIVVPQTRRSTHRRYSRLSGAH